MGLNLTETLFKTEEGQKILADANELVKTVNENGKSEAVTDEKKSETTTEGEQTTSQSAVDDSLTNAGLDINTLYSTIFPIGGIDDNNIYTELTGDKINSVQLVEPTVSVKEFLLKNTDMYEQELIDKYGYRIPLIAIDDYRIKQVDICSFKLDYTGFLPYLSFEFVDSSNRILSTNVPKDGTIIKVYIGGGGDELYYKPIRQDFVLTSIRKTGGEDQNRGNLLKYRVYGKLNVPYGYRKESWASGTSTAMQALFNVAVWTGLGFATNFTKTNTPDSMNWINTETGTYFDFMEDIAGHACYSPNTFFTSFIDQYNVLNFVECHSLLSHGGQKTDTPAMIYMSYPPYQATNGYRAGEPKTPENQLPPLKKTGDKEKDETLLFKNEYQQLSYYFITNHEKFMGWTNFIEEYHEIAESGSSLSDGFQANVKYTDSNDGGWGRSECNFYIRPIDNLKRDAATQKILPLEEKPTQESYIPLNLMQITNEDYVNDEDTVDNMTNVESFTNFGEVDTSNTFKQYYFAEVQNKYQLRCMKKCGLKVKLQNYNPAITKFSRIWVDIYDKNMFSTIEPTGQDLGPQKDEDNSWIKYKKMIRDNILFFEKEADKDRLGKFNRALSGWYVVTEIEIDYDPKENNLNMNLKLNRIEYKPVFKTEYERARKAIDKYKEDNSIEKILK